MSAPSLTIGIEEEYQIIDPNTGELKSYITQILDEGKLVLKEQIKAELHQSMVEGRHGNLSDAGRRLQRRAGETAAEHHRTRRAAYGLVIAAAGTHPFLELGAAGNHAVRTAISAYRTTCKTSPANYSFSERTFISESKTAISSSTR